MLPRLSAIGSNFLLKNYKIINYTTMSITTEFKQLQTQGLALKLMLLAEKSEEEIMHDLLSDTYMLEQFKAIEDLETFIFEAIPFAGIAKHFRDKLQSINTYLCDALENNNFYNDHIDDTHASGGTVTLLQGQYLPDNEYENAYLLSEIITCM